MAIQPAPVAATRSDQSANCGQSESCRIGGNVTYRVTITNIGRVDEPQVRLTLTLPPEMSLVRVLPFNAQQDTIRDERVIPFRPLLVLRPNESVNCDLVVRADRPGQAGLKAEVTSLNVVAPVSGTAITTISQ